MDSQYVNQVFCHNNPIVNMEKLYNIAKYTVKIKIDNNNV